MKAGDFEVDYSFGGNNGSPMTCCSDHIYENRNQRVQLGDTLTCEHCGVEMTLTRCEDNVIRWRAS